MIHRNGLEHHPYGDEHHRLLPRGRESVSPAPLSMTTDSSGYYPRQSKPDRAEIERHWNETWPEWVGTAAQLPEGVTWE